MAAEIWSDPQDGNDDRHILVLGRLGIEFRVRWGGLLGLAGHASRHIPSNPRGLQPGFNPKSWIVSTEYTYADAC
jgi:hypothetical protein